MTNSTIYGSVDSCLDLTDHIELLVSNTSIHCFSNNPTSENSIINFTDTNLIQHSSMQNSFLLGDNNHIKWISSQDILTPVSSFDNNILPNFVVTHCTSNFPFIYGCVLKWIFPFC